MAHGSRECNPLVGRTSELDRLRNCIDSTTRGRALAVLMEGEAGIGKSRLVDEAVAYARTRGCLVFRGSADRLEIERPFGAMIRALRTDLASPGPMRTRLTALMVPSPSTVMAPVEPRPDDLGPRTVEVVVTMIETELRSRTVVLVLEDLQWADPSTMSAIRAVLRRLHDRPLMVLLSLRSSPSRREVASLTGTLLNEGAEHLTIGPLDEAAVTALTESVVGATPAAELRAQVARGGGSPLWVLELLSSWLRQGSIEVVGGQAQLRTADLPPSLRVTILRRLSDLADDTFHVLKVASVLGSEFDPTDLAACLHRRATELMAPLEEALTAGVLGEAGESLVFRHDLIREVVYEGMPVAVRRSLHLEVGRALGLMGRPASTVAAHLILGATPGDAEAVGWLLIAAREAAPRSAAVAAELLEHGLRLVDPSDARRDRLTGELVAALVRSGRPVEAESLARQRLVLAPSTGEAGILRWGLAAALQVQGRLREALDETLAAADERGLPPWRRARLVAEAAQWSFYSGDRAQAAALADRAIASGERYGDDAAVCLGLTALSRIALDEADFGRAVALGRRAVQRASDSGIDRHGSDWIHPSFDLGGALVTADDLAGAEETLRAGRRLREELGSTWDLPLFTSAIAHAQLYAGRWDDAVAEATTALAMADEGAARGSLPFTYALLCYVAVHRNELETARELLCAANPTPPAGGPAMGGDHLLWCEGLLYEATGDLAGAAELLREAWDMDLPFRVVTRVRMAPDAVRLAILTGSEMTAQAVTMEMERLAARAGSPHYEGIALRCRGLTSGEPDDLIRAVAILRRSQRPVELAFACEDAGVALCKVGRGGEASALLEEALRVYENIGAALDVARTVGALRSAGARSSGTSTRRRPLTGWGSLTKSEQEVVALAGQGLTNSEIGARLFVSGRTVETHLSHVYRKLGIASRIELAIEVAKGAGTGSRH